ncbi:MAG: protein kinase family protein [Gracilimonas sp.]|uniref:protein kinase n=1 Tax=Gracilimonas sp. TaxID=1974203 RepID=UPI0019CD9820|nr:protein kinase [Gracilimonas sp.]MBD3616653.1 protein kinase family protein [Gracilimonas sp.]
MVQKYGRWRHVEGRPYTIVQNIEDPDIVGFIKFQKSSPDWPDWKERQFFNEVHTLKGLDHPNIVKLLDYDLEHETPYLITEYCECGDMREADLDKWTIEEKYQCHQQICEGFAYLWGQGILKGDHNLKNIFLKENKIPVIGDFEGARQLTMDAEGVLSVLNVASIMFWGLMEGKDFNRIRSMERRINQQIEALNEQIEELKAQKEELYNTPPP